MCIFVLFYCYVVMIIASFIYLFVINFLSFQILLVLFGDFRIIALYCIPVVFLFQSFLSSLVVF